MLWENSPKISFSLMSILKIEYSNRKLHFTCIYIRKVVSYSWIFHAFPALFCIYVSKWVTSYPENWLKIKFTWLTTFVDITCHRQHGNNQKCYWRALPPIHIVQFTRIITEDQIYFVISYKIMHALCLYTMWWSRSNAFF